MTPSSILYVVTLMAASCVHGFLPSLSALSTRRIVARASEAQDFSFEKRELGIWLDKVVDANRQLSLAPDGKHQHARK
jgi:hypothetical protein